MNPQPPFPPLPGYPPYPTGYQPHRASNPLPFILIAAAALALVAGLVVLAFSNLNSLPPLPSAATPQPTSPAATATLPTPTKTVQTTPTQFSGKPVDIEVWIPDYLDDKVRELIAAFDVSRPDLTISLEVIPSSDYETQLMTAPAAGTFPDVVLTYETTFPKLMDTLAPLPENTDFNPAAQEAVKYKGVTYGVPIYTSGIVMFYNKSNVSVSPTSIDSLKGLLTQGVRIGVPSIDYWIWGFLSAYGSEIMDQDGNCALNNPATEKALLSLQELHAAGMNFGDLSDLESSFQAGNLDILFDGSWMLQSFSDSLGNDLGVAPLPAGTLPAATINEAFSVAINKDSQYFNAGLDLALYLSKPESQVIIGDNGIGVPIRDVTLTSPLAQEVYLALHNRYTTPDPVFMTGFWSALSTPINDIIINENAITTQLEDACRSMDTANGK